MSRHASNSYLNNFPFPQSNPNMYRPSHNDFIHTIYSPFNQNLFQNFAINNPFQFQGAGFNKVHSTGNIHSTPHHVQAPWNPFGSTNSFNFQPRIAGRRESKPELKNSNTNLSQTQPGSLNENNTQHKTESEVKSTSVAEKRFGSLELKKHKCYSPTFYSMRCKKHGKKRPVIYALPKKVFTQIPTNKTSEVKKSNSFTTIADGVQIKEHSNDCNSNLKPKPKPRCKKHRRIEIIYQNVSNNINKSANESNLDSSKESIENNENNVCVITDAQIHASKDESKENLGDDNAALETTPSNKSQNSCPKVVDFDSKKSFLSPVHKVSPHAMKNSPTLKVSPNFVKPLVESPKGALSLQIQAKMKASPVQSPTTFNPPQHDPKNPNEGFPNIPQMPILDTQNKWSPKIANKQVCAFRLFLYFMFYV